VAVLSLKTAAWDLELLSSSECKKCDKFVLLYDGYDDWQQRLIRKTCALDYITNLGSSLHYGFTRLENHSLCLIPKATPFSQSNVTCSNNVLATITIDWGAFIIKLPILVQI